MSDTVKLIIEIPKDVYRTVHKHKSSILTTKQDDQEIVIGVRKGILLDDVKAEIADEYANTHHMYPDYASGLSHAYEIIDKHIGKESEDET